MCAWGVHGPTNDRWCCWHPVMHKYCQWLGEEMEQIFLANTIIKRKFCGTTYHGHIKSLSWEVILCSFIMYLRFLWTSGHSDIMWSFQHSYSPRPTLLFTEWWTLTSSWAFLLKRNTLKLCYSRDEPCRNSYLQNTLIERKKLYTWRKQVWVSFAKMISPSSQVWGTEKNRKTWERGEGQSDVLYHPAIDPPVSMDQEGLELKDICLLSW